MTSLAFVVENDPSTRKLLEVVLGRFDFEVDAVANGSDALVLLGSIDYDLTVLDLFIPGASGEDILDWLRKERPGAIERRVVLSSAPPKRLEEIKQWYPRATVMRKPFELHELIEVAKTLRRGRPGAADGITDRFARRSVVAGAKSGVIVRMRGTDVALIQKFGYAPNEAERWFPMSTSSPFPLCQCLRDGRPQWLASLAAAEPEFPHLASAWRAHQSRALATVPLIRNGVVLGAAGWTFREPQSFDEREQRAFLEIANEAAAELEAMQSVDATGA